MASAEHNPCLDKDPQAAQAANPAGDSGDSNWESAWIDLGGEG